MQVSRAPVALPASEWPAQSRRLAHIAPVPNTTYWRAASGGHGFYVPRTSDSHGEQWMEHEAGESFVAHVFATVLHGGNLCRQPALWRPLVIDVGANEGYFGLMSAAWGCDVEMYEPQPRCVSLIREAVMRNGFDRKRARVVPRPVSADPFNLTVTNAPFCIGGFPFHKSTRRTDTSASQEAPSLGSGLGAHFREGATRTVSSVSLGAKFGGRQGEARQQRIALVKIDVEGKELSVLRDLQPLMFAGLVDDIVVEVTPGWWAHDANAWQSTWQSIEHMGYVGRAHFDTDSTLRGHEHTDLRRMIEVIRARGKHRARAQANVWLRRRPDGRRPAGLKPETLSQPRISDGGP